jgi:hypothetical protein
LINSGNTVFREEQTLIPKNHQRQPGEWCVPPKKKGVIDLNRHNEALLLKYLGNFLTDKIFHGST